jgi:hypothetical protein
MMAFMYAVVDEREKLIENKPIGGIWCMNILLKK